MQKKPLRFFTDESVLDGSVLCLFVFLIVNLFSKLQLGLYTLFISGILLLACVAGLYIAFKTHTKNVQKGLIGCMLMWYLIDELNFASDAVISLVKGAAYNSVPGVIYIVLAVVTLLVYIALFVNHFLLAMDHKSSGRRVLFNQAAVLIVAAVSVAQLVCQVIMYKNEPWRMTEAVTWHIALIFYVFIIASYETVINGHKEEREKKTGE